MMYNITDVDDDLARGLKPKGEINMDFTEKDVLPEETSKRIRRQASMMAVGADLTEPGSHIFSTLRGVTLNDNSDFTIAIISRDEYNRLRQIEHDTNIISNELRTKIREEVEVDIRRELGMDWDEPITNVKYDMMLSGKVPDIDKPIKITGNRSIDLENLINKTNEIIQKPEIQEAFDKYVKYHTEKYGEDVNKWPV